jgi:hypothetical protein
MNFILDDTYKIPRRQLYSGMDLSIKFSPLNYDAINQEKQSPTVQSPSPNLSPWPYLSYSTTSESAGRDAPSMEDLERQLFHRIPSKAFLEVDSKLLINSIMALSCYYIQSNCIKCLANVTNVPKIRQNIVKLSAKYYGEALYYLRTLLSTKDYDITTAILASSLLNKIAIFEYPKLDYSITFSKGVFNILNDLFMNITQQDSNTKRFLSGNKSLADISWIINLLKYASKSYYFPTYDPQLLNEFLAVLNRLKGILLNLSPPKQIIFHFNHLFKFVLRLMSLIKTHGMDALSTDPILLYSLLRRWLVILPSKVHVLEYLVDPLEKTLMNLYSTLTKILDNLFPRVMFYFLQRFSGGLSLWSEPRQAHVLKEINHAHLYTMFDCFGDVKTDLMKINIYAFRVTSFFQKRIDILTVFFGDQRTKKEFPADIIRSLSNEVMIHDFNHTIIQYYHYLHLPGVVKFTKTPLIVDNLKHRFNAKVLFSYNRQQYKQFLSNDSNKLSKEVLQSTSLDPMLKFHISNTINNHIEKDLYYESDKEEKIPKVEEHSNGLISAVASTISAPSSRLLLFSNGSSKGSLVGHQLNDIGEGREDESGVPPQKVVNYMLLLEGSYSKTITKLLSRDYQKLFLGRYKLEPGEEISYNLNNSTGMLMEDMDPMLVVNELTLTSVFQRKIQDVTSDASIGRIVIDFYERRNSLFNQRLSAKNEVLTRRRRKISSENSRGKKQKTNPTAASPVDESNHSDTPEDDSVNNNFYDDLNDSYFTLY